MSLSTLELAQLRADQGDYFPDTCSFQAVASTSDGQGGWTEAWSDTATSVACRLAPRVGSFGEAMSGNQVASQSAWVLHVAHDQDVDAEWRVVHEGLTYEIVQLEATHSNRTARQVMLRRLE